MTFIGKEGTTNSYFEAMEKGSKHLGWVGFEPCIQRMCTCRSDTLKQVEIFKKSKKKRGEGCLEDKIKVKQEAR